MAAMAWIVEIFKEYVQEMDNTGKNRAVLTLLVKGMELGLQDLSPIAGHWKSYEAQVSLSQHKGQIKPVLMPTMTDWYPKAEYGPHSLVPHQPPDQPPQHPQHPQRRVYLQVPMLTNCESIDTAYHFLGSNEGIRDGGSLVSPLLCLHLKQDNGEQAKPVPGPQNQPIWGATHKERNRLEKHHTDELDTSTDITGMSNCSEEGSEINETNLNKHDVQSEPSRRSTHFRPANPITEEVMPGKANGDLARCRAESQLSGFVNFLQTHPDGSEEGA